LIDTAKAVGIVLIAMSHIVGTALPEFIRQFGVATVPLFILLAGQFNRPTENLLELAARRARSLLWPYLATASAVIIYGSWRGGAPTMSKLASMAEANGSAIPSGWEPMWFLPHLWLVSVCSSLLKRRLKWTIRSLSFRWGIVALAHVVGVLTMFLWSVQQVGSNGVTTRLELPWGAEFLLLSMSYDLAGGLLCEKIRGYKFSALRFGSTLLGLVIVTYWSAPTLDLNRRIFAPTPLVSVYSVLICISILETAAWFDRYSRMMRALAYLGRRSLLILVFHSAIGGAVGFQIAKRSPEAPRVVVGILALLAGVGGCLAMARLLESVPILSRLYGLPLRIVEAKSKRSFPT
jgi:fucose 4-O-acetylase-like acetyltransferase